MLKGIILALFSFHLNAQTVQKAAVPSSAPAAVIKKAAGKAPPKIKKAGSSFHGKGSGDLYDSGIVLGPGESLDDYLKQANQEDEKVQEVKSKVQQLKRKAASSKQEPDYYKMGPQELEKAKNDYWKNYQKNVKIRRSN